MENLDGQVRIFTGLIKQRESKHFAAITWKLEFFSPRSTRIDPCASSKHLKSVSGSLNFATDTPLSLIAVCCGTRTTY
jgi:hypothetical protein